MVQKMKLAVLVLLLISIIMPAHTYAVEIPDVSAGRKYMDFKSGCWVFTDNVYVHWQKRELTIRADEAKAQMGSQKVWANGNISLEWKALIFKCDNIFVQGKLKTVDILGNVDFVQEGIVKITSNVAKYSWGNKIADFYGNVNLNAKKVKLAKNLNINKSQVNGEYGHIQYDVNTQTIIALDKNYNSIPSTDFPEPDPTEQ